MTTTTTVKKEKNPADKLQDWYVDNLCGVLRTKLERMLLAAKKTIYFQPPQSDLNALLGEFVGAWDTLVALRHAPKFVSAPTATTMTPDSFARLCAVINGAAPESLLGMLIDDNNMALNIPRLSIRSVNELQAMGITTLRDLVTAAQDLFSDEYLSETGLDGVITWATNIAESLSAQKVIDTQPDLNRRVSARTIERKTRRSKHR